MQSFKLGLQPARHDPRTLKLRAALDLAALPALLPAVDNSAKVQHLLMLANDRIGNCAIVACANGMQGATAADGKEWIPDEADVLADYQVVSGWNGAEGDPSDVGCIMLDVMRHWQKQGICGRKIGPYLSLPWQDTKLVCQAIQTFGNVYLGMNLPAAVNGADAWDTPTGRRPGPQWNPGSWGGHAVVATGFDFPGQKLKFRSWGKRMEMEFSFLEDYGMEAWVVIDPGWTGPDFKAPNGLSLAALNKLFSRIPH